MHGRNCAMTRSGMSYIQQKMMENHRPRGVKASKAGGKKAMVDGKELAKFQTMWTIKKQDLEIKERLSKMKLLDSLLGKQEPLQDYEEAPKQKLITELMSN
ncbi:hypothetical protein F2Q68_00036442 [Brassica cretica]|nr:hypothetical protein F2Q68_00036442 [Brassica cretica]